MLNGRPWQLESALMLLVRLVACAICGMLALTILSAVLGEKAVRQSIFAMGLIMTATHGGALVTTGLLLRDHAVTWAEAFGLRRQVGWAFTLATASFVLVLPAMWFIQSATIGQLQQWGYDFEPQEAVKLLQETHDPLLKALLGVFAVLIAPIAEEVFFRGFLYPFVKQYTSRGFALITVSVFFAAIHGNIPVLPALFLLAVVLTALYEWTGNLLASITLHFLFNLANFVAMFLVEKYADQLRNVVQ